jgi:succinoglycan biosynthesis transport protein ExoP
MAEDLEEKPTEGLDLEQYWGVVRRRHWYFLAVLFLAWLGVWGASWFLPSVYKSGTLILVEQPTMPKDYVVPNVSDDLQERLQSITQQILSRTRLLRIIDELNLYADRRGRSTPDEIAERMRKDIEIELVRDEHRAVTAFNVYYSARDPHVAQRVTSELTNLFISENLEVRQRASEDTTNFLASQLEEAGKNLAEQEQKVREFKDRHPGDLPTQLGSNLQILGGLQNQQQIEGDALNAAKQQNVYLQSLLNQYRTLQKMPTNGDGAPVGLPAINDELDKLRAQLADLSSHYTERHPDVRKLKDQIAKTEKMRDQIIADLKASPTKAEPKENPDTTPQSEAEIRDSSPMFQLQSQLRSNQIEITNREHALAALQAKIDAYQAHLNQEPTTEQQLTDLSRGYEQSKANYDELLKKKNASEMATSMELRQQGEHFRVIDPPSLPVKPAFPNHFKFCAVGLVVGLVLGTALAGGVEFLDDRLYSEKAMKELLPVGVISELPSFTTPEEENTERRKLWAAWATAALVFVTILGGFAYSYLRG